MTLRPEVARVFARIYEHIGYAYCWDCGRRAPFIHDGVRPRCRQCYNTHKAFRTPQTPYSEYGQYKQLAKVAAVQKGEGKGGKGG